MEEKKLMLTTDLCNNEDTWRGREMKEEKITIMSNIQIKKIKNRKTIKESHQRRHAWVAHL